MRNFRVLTKRLRPSHQSIQCSFESTRPQRRSELDVRLVSTPMHPRIQLVLDFDRTITTSDTTSIIGSHCLAKARELALPTVSPDEPPKPMQHYSNQYLREYQVWKQTRTQPEHERTTIDEEVSCLSQSKQIEQDSFLRVRSACLDVPGGMREMEGNEGMRNEFMMQCGRLAVRRGEIGVRDPEGLKSLIARAEKEGSMWGIVSVSWSLRFILGCLVEAGLVMEERVEDVAGRIRCNELFAPLDYDGEKGLSILCSARDKLEAFHALLADWETKRRAHGCPYTVSSEHADEDATITIYVGDSSTDLGCLAGPAMGMYMLQSDPGQDDVVQRLKRLGIECRPIETSPTSDVPVKSRDMATKLREGKKPPHLICSIEDFHEVGGWISKLG